MSYLFDASSIFDSFGSGKIRKLPGGFTASISRYEVCNVLWKHTCLLGTHSSEESSIMLSLILDALDKMYFMNIVGYEQEILDLSIQLKTPFYDSTYLYFAREESLTLVTEDKKMREHAATLGVESLSILDL